MKYVAKREQFAICGTLGLILVGSILTSQAQTTASRMPILALTTRPEVRFPNGSVLHSWTTAGSGVGEAIFRLERLSKGARIVVWERRFLSEESPSANWQLYWLSAQRTGPDGTLVWESSLQTVPPQPTNAERNQRPITLTVNQGFRGQSYTAGGTVAIPQRGETVIYAETLQPMEAETPAQTLTISEDMLGALRRASATGAEGLALVVRWKPAVDKDASEKK